MKRPCVCEKNYNVCYLAEIPQIFPQDGTSYVEKLVNKACAIDETIDLPKCQMNEISCRFVFKEIEL